MRYAPEIFDQPDLESQRRIILGPDAGLTTDQRWVQETAYLREKLIFSKGPIIDYGCGIGRLTGFFKDVEIIGVDQSLKMLHTAKKLNPSIRFYNHNLFYHIYKHQGFKANGAFAVWVLQHCPDPYQDIALINMVLKPGSPFYVVGRGRYVPYFNGESYEWGDDKLDITHILEQRFILTEHEPMPSHLCAPGATFQKWVKR